MTSEAGTIITSLPASGCFLSICESPHSGRVVAVPTKVFCDRPVFQSKDPVDGSIQEVSVM